MRNAMILITIANFLLMPQAIAEKYAVDVDASQIYDSDTIMDVHLTSKSTGSCIVSDLRLLGIDGPEIRTKDLEEKRKGFQSRDWLRARLRGKAVEIEAHGRGKFGRVLATIWVDDKNINKEMVKKGLAVPFMEGI